MRIPRITAGIQSVAVVTFASPPGVANGPYVGQDFSALPPAPWLAAEEPDTRVELPPLAAAYAFGGIVAAVALSFLGALVAALVLPHSRFLTLVLSQTGLWTGL